jgi:hypothetical protein
MAEMAGRAPKVDRKLVKMLGTHFQVAQKVVVEVLAHHQFDLGGLSDGCNDSAKHDPSEKKAERPKLGLKVCAPEAREAREPSDTDWVKAQRSELSIEKSVLERRRAELDRREKELLAREKALEARAEEMDEPDEDVGGDEEGTKTLVLPERDPEATVLQLHTKGMWLQSLLVREAKIAELRRDLDRALDLLEQREAQPQRVVEEMPGVGPIKVFGGWYMRRREDAGDET